MFCFPVPLPRAAFFLAPILAAIVMARTAKAADTWTTPHPGLRLLHRTTTAPLQIWALQVDACARGVSHRATSLGERQRTPTSFRNLVGAQAVINGDFFSYTDYYPIGMAVGEGTLWHDDNGSFGFLAAGNDRLFLSPAEAVVTSLEGWIRQAVGGYPTLVRDGAAQYGATAPSHCPERHPRTAVGLSRDRQHLYLVVVDGRTTASRGMTCDELADLMVDLGAFSALNLDGGGSTAMSISGLGTVNDPSDGSERVVSNHWAVFADGTGAPGSCDLWMDELIVDSGVLNQGRSTDVDGDGRSDFCARGAAGLRCYLSTGSGFSPDPWLISELSDEAGFSTELHYSTIRTGDLDGDGRMDVCARGAEGVRCWASTGSGFGPAFAGPTWTDGSGWGALQHASTFRLADVTGDGRDDFCALAAAGWVCYPSTGSGLGASMAGPAWTSANGWHQPYYYGTIRTGDLDGDGRADVCARGSAGMWCALSTGTGFAPMFAGPAWSNDAGFTDVAYWTTIRLADLDGDGAAELCARTPDGVACHRYQGNETFGPALLGPGLTDASGWKDLDNTSTIRLGDLDGDGDLDLCARANAGIRCWLFESDAWGSQLEGPAWDEASGWDDFRLYASINLGDLDGDGRADLCARGADGVRCHLSTGAGFGSELVGPSLTDASGWAGYPYFSTIRFGGTVPPVTCVPVADDDATCDAADDDCDGILDEDADAACDDQDACNGLETCDGAGCAAGTPPDCAGRGCLPESGCCPEGTVLQGGACVPSVSCDPEQDTCDDLDRCNGVEVCDPEQGVCVLDADPLDCGERGCLPTSGCCPQGTHVEGGACVLDESDPGARADAGCGCATHGPVRRTAAPLLLLVLALLALRRRRR